LGAEHSAIYVNNGFDGIVGLRFILSLGAAMKAKAIGSAVAPKIPL
jgi:hypothetical protein